MDEQFVNELATALRKVGTIHTVGEEWHSYTGEIPVGGVPYCGQMVTRATYSALWKYAQEKYLVLDEANWQMYAQANGGNVPFYSSGDGSTTFRMPRIVGYVKGASSQSEAGTHLFEGLPNITGSVHPITGGIQAVDGAFYRGGSPSVVNAPVVGGTNGAFYLDASRSNPIYGSSDHVTPETSVVLFGVYAFGAIVETGELDATTLSNGLATLEVEMEGCEIVTSTGTTYHRYKSGIQFCWGTATPNNGSGTVTFPAPFKTVPIVMATSRTIIDTECNSTVYVDQVSSSNFGFYKLRGNAGNQVADDGLFFWFAFGHWK